MEEANNIILVLSVLLLIISVVGTALLLEKISVGIAPTPQTTQRGEVKVTILPPPNSVSTTGYIGLNILPSENG